MNLHRGQQFHWGPIFKWRAEIEFLCFVLRDWVAACHFILKLFLSTCYGTSTSYLTMSRTGRILHLGGLCVSVMFDYGCCLRQFHILSFDLYSRKLRCAFHLIHLPRILALDCFRRKSSQAGSALWVSEHNSGSPSFRAGIWALALYSDVI